MSVRLAGSTMVSRVEEGEKPPFLAVVLRVSPRLQASVGCFQVILLQQVRLLLIELCCEDEVLRDDWVLVQDEQVGWVVGRYVCYPELCWGIVEGIRLLGRRIVVLLWFRLPRKGRTIAELKLQRMYKTTSCRGL